MKNRFEFIAVVLIGNGESTDDFTVYIAKMADRLTTQLEIAKKALQTIVESSPQDNEAAKIIAAEALKSIVE
ncbi:hypothetical protein BBR47_59020 [Brevibacillus brevis NBRC 100599]|uniref:Uncharacterized protein n=1 Tax=Brevibacillus brevis (strain 47 / JCM 6285 / NBRC 100599) TaxID=358681 RepID=C0ZA25_BREBN|nr:hypothetical protein [Brevibacillus brevis]BAH46879.1 hypothetical protein BBR47_59020 [Brevibacillus brevis NBRC 100599]